MEQQYFLGVDIGKYHHQASLINEHRELIGESLRFDNNRAGFAELDQLVAQVPNSASISIGMEATGHYYWPLRDHLLQQGLNRLEIINPITTQQIAKTKIRKVKNDKVDSLIIAELISQKEVKPNAPTNQQLKQLKELTRFCEKVKGQSAFYKQEITNQLDRLCPEFSQQFTNIFLVTPLMIIKKYFLENISTPELIKLIVKTSRGKIKVDKATKVVELLNNSAGNSYRNPHSQFQLQLLLQSLDLTLLQIEQIKQQVEIASQESTIKTDIANVDSIIGISNYMASVMVSEIGDINRFDKKEQLVAFAGLDASIKESGQYQRKQGNHISKRGSKYLRKQLYYGAKTAIIFDSDLKAFYHKKKAQGKHYNLIMIAIARKLLLRVYAVLKQKRPYEPKALKVFSDKNIEV